MGYMNLVYSFTLQLYLHSVESSGK
jgi:hypothetical protein